MKLLMFAARHFRWCPFERTLPDVPDAGGEAEVHDAAVIFVHIEAEDEARRSKVLTKTLKNVKWLAGKRGLRRVVFHSFTHLGGETSNPALALSLLEEMAERLRRVGYQVWLTPFGWVCEWDLSVYGESLAKVFKSL
ncbi:MAG: threonyl-tRNA synthetase editing domain-containing protein [Anaerolineae bacterium]